MSDPATLKAAAAARAAYVKLSAHLTTINSAAASLAALIEEVEDLLAGTPAPQAAEVVAKTQASAERAEVLTETAKSSTSTVQAVVGAVVAMHDAALQFAARKFVEVLPASATVAGSTLSLVLRFRGPLPLGQGYRAQLHLNDAADPTGRTFVGRDFELDKAERKVDGDVTSVAVQVPLEAIKAGAYKVSTTLFTIAPGPRYPALPGITRGAEVAEWGGKWIVAEFVKQAAPPAPAPAPTPVPPAPQPPAPPPTPPEGAPTFLRPFPKAPHWQVLPGSRREFGATDIRTQAIRGQHGGGGWVVNFRQWTQGLWVAKASDPKRMVRLTAAGIDWGVNNPRPRERLLPIPPDLKPDTGASDAHATVYYPPGVLPDAPFGAWLELWQARPQADGSWRATSGVLVRAEGDGLNLSTMQGQNEGGLILMNGGGGAARASGMSSTLGLIREGELVNGINHALYFGLPGEVLTGYRCEWPATKDEHNGTANKIALWMGKRMCLPGTLKIDTLGLRTVHGRNVATALQRHGGICGDLSANRSFNADRNSAKCIFEVEALLGSQDLTRITPHLVLCEV